MQQAGQATTSRLTPPGSHAAPVAVPDPAFVINVCASTTPMALPRPDHPELKRFTFFISRRREDGRERFRLHMGYFQSQEEAEQLLGLVREIYPAAWAGVAPGQRLRAAAGGGALADGVRSALPKPGAMPVAIAPQLPAMAAAPSPPAALPPSSTPTQPLTAAAPPPAPASAAVPAPAAALRASASLAAVPPSPAAQSLHSVRATIDALEGSGPRSPPTLAPPVDLRAVPVARPAVPPAPVKAPPAAATAAPLGPKEVLRVLETPAPAPRAEVAGYAVQLMWSVQPIDMGAVPQLAIFSAYTLYGAAGNRDGRRWYGLRLGFFTDAVSARQVANYVRSEFAAVSIVPVSARERERALAAAQRAPLPDAEPSPKKVAVNIASSGEFRLLDEQAAPKTPPAAPPPRPARGAPGKRAKLRNPPAAAAAPQKRRPPLSLEETLEILGASELKLQDGRDDPLNDTGVRHLGVEAMKGRGGSRFSKLMERLSERFSGG
jgi:hypothetical protein